MSDPTRPRAAAAADEDAWADLEARLAPLDVLVPRAVPPWRGAALGALSLLGVAAASLVALFGVTTVERTLMPQGDAVGLGHGVALGAFVLAWGAISLGVLAVAVRLMLGRAGTLGQRDLGVAALVLLLQAGWVVALHAWNVGVAGYVEPDLIGRGTFLWPVNVVCITVALTAVRLARHRVALALWVLIALAIATLVAETVSNGLGALADGEVSGAGIAVGALSAAQLLVLGWWWWVAGRGVRGDLVDQGPVVERSPAAPSPGLPVRPTGIQVSWTAPSLATAAVLVVAIAVAGAWFAFRSVGTPGAPEGSASPTAASGLATWWVDPLALPLSDGGTTIRGFIREQACANGASPEGRVLEPGIEYRPDAIVITFRVTMSPGDCPSNPSFPVVVTLAEPIGGRALLDGSEDPPRDATTGDPQAAPSGPASWWVDPVALPLADDARVISGFIRERACASGTSPEGRVLEPTIEYSAVAIIITFSVEMLPSGRCPSNPAYPVEVHLAEPVAGRALLDGSDGPPRDATAGDPAGPRPSGPPGPVPSSAPLVASESPVQPDGLIPHCVAIRDWWTSSPVIAVWMTRDRACRTRSSSVWTPLDISYDPTTGDLRYRFDLIPDGEMVTELRLQRIDGRLVLRHSSGRDVTLGPIASLDVPEEPGR